MATTPQFPYTPVVNGVTLVNADGTALKTMLNGAAASANGPGGTRLDSIFATSDDTAAREVQLWMFDSVASRLICSVNVPIGAGNSAAVPGIHLLNRTACPWITEDGALIVPLGQTLQVKVLTAVTAAKSIYIIGYGGAFA